MQVLWILEIRILRPAEEANLKFYLFSWVDVISATNFNESHVYQLLP